MRTDPLGDYQTRTTTRADETADIVEALEPADALVMPMEDAPAVVRELKRRGRSVGHDVRRTANGEARSFVYIDGPPAA
jgi:hypothetical protein